MRQEKLKRAGNAKPISLYPMTLEQAIRRAIKMTPRANLDNETRVGTHSRARSGRSGDAANEIIAGGEGNSERRLGNTVHRTKSS
jgi:hypothetical protein